MEIELNPDLEKRHAQNQKHQDETIARNREREELKHKAEREHTREKEERRRQYVLLQIESARQHGNLDEAQEWQAELDVTSLEPDPPEMNGHVEPAKPTSLGQVEVTGNNTSKHSLFHIFHRKKHRKE